MARHSKSFAFFQSMSAWSRFFSYLFIGICSMLVVHWCGKIAFEHQLPLENGSLNQDFYWWLRVPSCFVSMVCAAIITRTVLRAVTWVKPGFRLFKWFYPMMAIRDIFLLSLAFGLVYLGVTFAGARFFDIRDFHNDSTSFVLRGFAIVALTALAVNLLDHFEWISTGAIVPEKANLGYRILASALYGIAAVVAMKFVGDFLPTLFYKDYYHEQLRWFTAASFATFVCLILILLLLWVFDRGDEQLFPIKIRLAIVGPASCGKTLLFTQVFRSLSAGATLGLKISPHEERNEDGLPQISESTRILMQHASNARIGLVPPPSLVPTLLDFDLIHDLTPVAYYSWMDMPGEIFAQWSEPTWLVEKKAFLEQLPQVSGLMIAFSAYAGDGDDAIGEHRKAMTDSIDAYMTSQMRNPDSGGAPSVAIVITQWRRPSASQRDALREAQEIKKYADRIAQKYSIVNFKAQIFKCDSMVNALPENANKPPSGQGLQWWCVIKPVLWLAARAFRTKMGTKEMAKLPFSGATVPAVQVVGVLEQLEMEAR